MANPLQLRGFASSGEVEPKALEQDNRKWVSSSREEIPHIKSKKQWLRFAGAAVQIPHVQVKRNPTRMVGTERGHPRADRLKPGEGNCKPHQYSCLEKPVFLPWETHEQYEKANTEKGTPQVGRCPPYATGDQWRSNSRKNEGMEQKQEQHPVVDATGDRSKVQCCKEQYCIGAWNVRSMNQGKLEVIKQEMTRVNVEF